MKSIKFLKKQSNKASKLSFKKGELNISTAKKFINSFKQMHLGESVPALNFYLEAIKRELSKTTLTIQSAVKVLPLQEKQISSSFKKEFKILDIKQEINPLLLGGVKVKIGDIVFDASVKQRLEQLKEAIVN